ncbi:MAG: DPP IV N-terminal domain-containing protein [Candidatus Limnocylindrales bacterium]
MATPPTGPASGLSIESIVAVDSPREFRVHPRDRAVAYTAESAGARQLFTLSLRSGGPPVQLTASEKPISDPQWSPDGRRLAFVREDEIWIVEADGARLVRVVAKPGGGRGPRWSPDGKRLAFLSRRRGWSQVWLIDAPVPRRGRPQRDPRPPQAHALTPAGVDVESAEWAPDGARLAVVAQQRPDDMETTQIALVDASSGALEIVAGLSSLDTGARGSRMARSCSCPMRTAGSRSSGARPTDATGSCSPTASANTVSRPAVWAMRPCLLRMARASCISRSTMV